MEHDDVTVTGFGDGAECAARYLAVRDRIADAARAAGRDPAEVRLLPVSKTVPAERLRRAWPGL
ncbi:MAG TPA: YggS family pyridoxal phosphate-dependent enzyme, partial [Actinomycetales bacterium]|nr:YggS family pyridoxal phosphate-dependent enzyme [Actinomycetales bacterium]